MMRVAALIICACWIASSQSAASAQSLTLPNCDYKAVDAGLAAGAIPDMKGCYYPEIAKILEVRHRRGIPDYDPTVTGIRRDVIATQSDNDGIVFFGLATGNGYPPTHPTFTIVAPPQVQEGEPIPVTVHLQGGDGRPHHITLTYDHAELMADKPPSFDFDPKNTDEIHTVDTAKGRPGDGDRSITIGLQTGEDATVGDRGSATVKILDTLPTTYTVEAPHGVGRGGSMEFTVTRHGPADPAQAEYQFDQPNGAIDQAWRPINFDQNGIAKLALVGDAYRICADPPLVRIRVGSQALEEAASFSDYVPKECRPKPGILEWLQENVPYWPLPAIPVGALLGFGLWKLARRLSNGKNGDPGPPPVLYPTWDIEGGHPPPLPDPPEISNWPKFSCEVEIEWGGSDVPDPLPIAEPIDG